MIQEQRGCLFCLAAKEYRVEHCKDLAHNKLGGSQGPPASRDTVCRKAGHQDLPDGFSHRMLSICCMYIILLLLCLCAECYPSRLPPETFWSVSLNKPMAHIQLPGGVFGLMASQAQILELFGLSLNNNSYI